MASRIVGTMADEPKEEYLNMQWNEFAGTKTEGTHSELDMNRKSRRVISMVLVVLLGTSCAHTIEQSSEFADAGIKYAEAMDKLLQATIETAIDDDNRTLLYLQKLSSESAKLEKYLAEHDETLKKHVEILTTLRHQNRTLNHYFVNLRALATADVSANTVEAVNGLSSAINRANETITETRKNLISNEEQKAIASLAGLVAKGIQAGKLRDALRRDGPIIDKQLLLHKKLLKMLSEELEHSAKKQYVIDRKTIILRPYKKKTIDDVDAWKEARKQLLLASFNQNVLETAVLAATEMREVWRDIIENKPNVKSVNLLIGDLNQLVTAVELMQEARKE